jgi:5'-3' exoribonuclease 2
MGHIGEKGLRSMHNKGMVESFPNCNSEVNFCEHYIYGKQKRVRFPSRVIREKEIMELIHSDVFGPVSLPSHGGSLYYVSFVDDFLRKTHKYFLGKKSKVFNEFKEFKYLVENQTDKKIKVLRIDNGGELC